MDKKIIVELYESTLPSLDAMIDRIKGAEDGAVAVFQGITRNNFNGKKVKTLIYEGYDKMAKKELEKIAHEAIEKFQLSAIYVCHRLNEVVNSFLIFNLFIEHQRVLSEHRMHESASSISTRWSKLGD